MICSYFLLFLLMMIILYYFYKDKINENYNNYTRKEHDFFLNPSLTLSSDHEKNHLLRYVCNLPCK